MRRIVKGVAFCILIFLCLSPARAVEKLSEAEKQFIFAQGLFEENKFSLASEQFQVFLDKYPEDENCDKAYFLMGLSFWYLEEYEKAISSFNTLLRNYPVSNLIDRALYWMGECHLQVKDYPNAISSYRRLIEKYPQSQRFPFALYSLGYAFFYSQNYKEALKSFRRLKDNFPDFEDISGVQYNIARILYLDKNYSEAAKEYSEFIQKFPDSKNLKKAYLERGFCYYYLRDFERAKESFLKAGVYYWEGEALYALGRYEEARKAYKKSLSNPEEKEYRCEANYGIAYMYFRERNYEKAEKFFRDYISFSPECLKISEAWVHLGDSLYFQNKFEQARECYEKVIN